MTTSLSATQAENMGLRGEVQRLTASLDACGEQKQDLANENARLAAAAHDSAAEAAELRKTVQQWDRYCDQLERQLEQNQPAGAQVRVAWVFGCLISPPSLTSSGPAYALAVRSNVYIQDQVFCW